MDDMEYMREMIAILASPPQAQRPHLVRQFVLSERLVVQDL
jgi:hypothetical protein